MYNYCTLFNIDYLIRGLAMYESLKKHSVNFHLYIFVFDIQSYDLLKKLNLTSVTVISQKEFEDEELLKVKASRSIAEYCWTCTPHVIKFSIDNFNLDNCTYLDADIYFFSNPEILVNEIENSSIIITDHRFSPMYDQSSTVGIYNVQFLTFKNDKNGMEALNWWRKQCIIWCYNRFENGKFGDKKYLDDWLVRFKGVNVLKNLGAGVAPWNIQQYKIEEIPFNLVFYHFHGINFLLNNKIDLGNYRLKKKDLEIIYKPYLIHLEKIKNSLSIIDNNLNFERLTEIKKFNFVDMIKNLKRKLNNSYNIYNKKYILEL